MAIPFDQWKSALEAWLIPLKPFVLVVASIPTGLFVRTVGEWFVSWAKRPTERFKEAKLKRSLCLALIHSLSTARRYCEQMLGHLEGVPLHGDILDEKLKGVLIEVGKMLVVPTFNIDLAVLEGHSTDIFHSFDEERAGAIQTARLELSHVKRRIDAVSEMMLFRGNVTELGPLQRQYIAGTMSLLHSTIEHCETNEKALRAIHDQIPATAPFNWRHLLVFIVMGWLVAFLLYVALLPNEVRQSAGDAPASTTEHPQQPAGVSDVAGVDQIQRTEEPGTARPAQDADTAPGIGTTMSPPDFSAFYYTYSTIAQTLAGAFAFLVAVVLYQLQTLANRMESTGQSLVSLYPGDTDVIGRRISCHDWEEAIPFFEKGDFSGRGDDLRSFVDTQVRFLKDGVAKTTAIQAQIRRSMLATGIVVVCCFGLISLTAFLPTVVRWALLVLTLAGAAYCLWTYWRLGNKIVERKPRVIYASAGSSFGATAGGSGVDEHVVAATPPDAQGRQPQARAATTDPL